MKNVMLNGLMALSSAQNSFDLFIGKDMYIEKIS